MNRELDPSPPPPPTRREVEQRFIGVLGGSQTRAEVDEWAGQWVVGETVPEISDRGVWRALGLLYGVAIRDGLGRYLIRDVQVSRWLNEFRRSEP